MQLVKATQQSPVSDLPPCVWQARCTETCDFMFIITRTPRDLSMPVAVISFGRRVDGYCCPPRALALRAARAIARNPQQGIRRWKRHLIESGGKRLSAPGGREWHGWMMRLVCRNGAGDVGFFRPELSVRLYRPENDQRAAQRAA